MTTMHDDVPHPVPPLAYLRWKENYFFIVIDPDNEVFGVAHFNFEPSFDRARLSCNFTAGGRLHAYVNETPFPADFALSRELGDDRLRLRFEEPSSRFAIAFDGEELGLSLTFTGRFPTFDFSACKDAAPELATFREIMTFGFNLPYNHQQQGLRVDGTATLRAEGREIPVSGFAYRDHSWCMRSDNMVGRHSWSALCFPDCVFGVKVGESVIHPGHFAKEGYVADADGLRALRGIDVTDDHDASTGAGMSPVMSPGMMVHRLRDVFGREYTIESDLGGRLAEVPLLSQRPDGPATYTLTESFCRSRIVETDAIGYSLIETGVSTASAARS